MLTFCYFKALTRAKERKKTVSKSFRVKLKCLPIRLPRNVHILSLLYYVLFNPTSPWPLKEYLRYLCITYSRTNLNLPKLTSDYTLFHFFSYFLSFLSFHFIMSPNTASRPLLLSSVSAVSGGSFPCRWSSQYSALPYAKSLLLH